MTLRRAHTSVNAADPAKLLLLKAGQNRPSVLLGPHLLSSITLS